MSYLTLFGFWFSRFARVMLYLASSCRGRLKRRLWSVSCFGAHHVNLLNDRELLNFRQIGESGQSLRSKLFESKPTGAVIFRSRAPFYIQTYIWNVTLIIWNYILYLRRTGMLRDSNGFVTFNVFYGLKTFLASVK